MTHSEQRLQLSSVDGTVTAVGEIDAETASRVEADLDDRPADSQVRFDTSGVTFMDSSGLRVLVAQHQRFDAAGGRLEIVHPSKPVMRLLEITALSEVFHVVAAD